MKFPYLYLVLLLGVSLDSAQAQGRTARTSSNRGRFSLSNLSSANRELPDSLLNDSTALTTTRRITAYALTPLLGERYEVPMDTSRLNYAISTVPDAYSLATGFLANVGSPFQTKIFSERKEARDFIFADAYDPYITTATNALFYDTKVPYTQVTYTTGGASQNKMDRLKGVMTINFGKHINVGGDLDYIYSRGYYNSNGNKLLSYRLFGNYLTDRYELHAYLSNFNFINFENGGMTDDRYITEFENLPESQRRIDTKSYPVRFTQTWNRVRGKEYFLTHRYNLGFTRELDETDEEGNLKEQFIPVSSLIHTVHYTDNRRRFISKDAAIDTCYTQRYGIDKSLNDQMSTWNLKNTVALAMREGFQDWAKFGLTAFATFEKRKFRLAAPIPNPVDNLDFATSEVFDEFTTYIGGELSKRRGSLLTYNVRGEVAIAGSDAGELRVEGELKTRFKLLGKEASVQGEAYIKNLTPAFFQRHFHGRYFWWDKSLSKTQRVYAGAKVNIESTRTQLSGGVESIQNYVYFGSDGTPQQSDKNIQVITLRLKQDFTYRAFGWENEACYQLSSEKSELPLPTASIHSNIYVAPKLAKVLTVQLGADVHYHTAYYAPYYEPATQQFQTQSEVKVGNYPLINAYVNMHLKQTRFFIMAYNIGSKFVKPNYFSLAHYPLDPMSIRMGIAVMFNN